MRVKLQLVMCNDQGDEETVTDIITLNKRHQRIEHLGLTLAESKHLLSTLQLKARGSRSFRTLFGTCKVYSPRLESCDCTRRKTSSFRPLSVLLTDSKMTPYEPKASN